MVEVKGAQTKKEEAKPLDLVTMRWNGVVDALENAQKNWDEMQRLLSGIPREEVQCAPMQVQKAVARFKRAKFEVMLERFVTHYRAFGGLEAMKVKGGVK